MKARYLVMVACALMVLSGCGIKGPLKAPQPSAEKAGSQPTSTKAPPASEPSAQR